MESQEELEAKVGPRADLLMCLDSIRLPCCTRTPHVGSGISGVKATKEKYFIITLYEMFLLTEHSCSRFSISCFLLILTQDGQRYSKLLRVDVDFLVRVSPEGNVLLFRFLMLEPFVKYFHPCIVGSITSGMRVLATYSFESLHFIKHIPVPPVFMCYQLIVSIPIDVSKIVEDLSTISASMGLKLKKLEEPNSLQSTCTSWSTLHPVEEGRSTVEGLTQSVYMYIASCSPVGQLPCGEPGGA
ncbi:hypothetical protein M9H77_36224 [Catharanthus roseus]|uniref:Uncharacterized protein n=1 Tax=Catharanthus roseus TaxID=4058 RepID=A0ACB9ZT05_CATRO|nr:hypothetical protein M9H77_36224 [Catharanthus roseus]